MDSPELCGHCRLPIHPAESGIRSYGGYRAHREQRCIELLRQHLNKTQLFARMPGTPTGISLENLSAAIEYVSSLMLDVGVAMEYYGGFSELAQHGREMIGASHIASGWADVVRSDYAPTEKPVVPQPPAESRDQVSIPPTPKNPKSI